MERQTQNNGRVVDIEKPTVNMIMQSDTLFKNNSQVSLKGIVEQSKISEIYFSEENIDVIQQTIRFQIFKRTNKIISKQSNNELIIVMRSIFLQYGMYEKVITSSNENVLFSLLLCMKNKISC